MITYVPSTMTSRSAYRAVSLVIDVLYISLPVPGSTLGSPYRVGMLSLACCLLIQDPSRHGISDPVRFIAHLGPEKSSSLQSGKE